MMEQLGKKAIIGIGIVALAAASWTAAAEIESSITRGGRLYDKWYKVIDADKPKIANPAYPSDGKYAKKPGATWRCKECHGWDTLGKQGAYSKGKHYTGIVGINAMAGADTDKVIAIITDATHGYGGKLSDRDLQDLANFVTKANVNYDDYIDRATKKVKGGNVDKGAAYFNNVCANCHGINGTEPDDMGKTLAKQMGNPWEVMHKILNGHPGEEMPAMRPFDRQVVVDIMAYIETLPTKK